MKVSRRLVVYSLVGGFVFFVDIGSFLGFLYLGLYRPLASSVSFIMGICCHFFLNRKFTFKNYDRSLDKQIGTYLVVATFSLILTVVLIEFLVGTLQVLPFIAKIIVIAINVPVGYFGHKYLTFGRGIRDTLKNIRGRVFE